MPLVNWWKTLATNGEEITNAVISNGYIGNLLVNWSSGSYWYWLGRHRYSKLIIGCYSNNMTNVIKSEADWQMIGKQLAIIMA